MSTLSSAVVGAALVPGMPHVLGKDPAASWADLRTAIEEAGRRLRAAGAETLVVMSTQWFTVLGHQFQLDPNPRGERVDENWYAYDYGKISYDFRTDTGLTEQWAQLVSDSGLQARRTLYDGFPIDTGAVVATSLLDPGSTFRYSMVSCNLYADVEDLSALGAHAIEAAEKNGRRVGVVVVSGLSSGLIQRWIEPHEDRISDPVHDVWNRRVLEGLVSGRSAEVMGQRDQYAREAAADSQFRVLAFLLGTGVLAAKAEVLSYGPIWGTGAAVVYWDPSSTTDK